VSSDKRHTILKIINKENLSVTFRRLLLGKSQIDEPVNAALHVIHSQWEKNQALMGIYL
jgi:hypothetical protein